MSSGAVNGIYFGGGGFSTPRSVIYVAVRLLSDDSRFVRSQWRKNRTSVLSACKLVLYILLFGPGIAVYNTHIMGVTKTSSLQCAKSILVARRAFFPTFFLASL